MAVGEPRCHRWKHTTFNHLGETGSELKSNQPKSSILALSLALWTEETGHCYKPASGRTIENLLTWDRPSHQRNPGLKQGGLPPKLSNREGQHPLPHRPAYQL
jgi:hypothetical protein